MDKLEFEIKEKINLKELLKSKNISTRAYKKIINNLVYVNDEKISKNIGLKAGDKVKILIEDENLNYEPINKKIKILYEDKDIVAVDKPPNLTVNSKNQESLSNYLAYYFKENKIKSQIRLINRLDMNTSGIMLVAKNPFSHAYYQNQIENNELDKEYLALVEGNLIIDDFCEIDIDYDKENKKMKVVSDKNHVKTYFKTLKNYGKFSLIYCKIYTGKTHQIRLSLAYLNHPILGDNLYGSKYDIERFLLHAYRIKFKSFRDQKKITILSKPDFDKYLNSKLF
ncbi:pseudouridine synthase, RluA family [Anaerococcus hydrogenalis DSM 7454]|uniref:RNA pseudouridylate synthase n=1 Tax=Anaerococcus hydrogenalis DSM 7454 TaxID=561177 RepID=B6W8A0_9FIRM|nr:RluA family pseudouridine synthase [Anaerococcus hydrogenalis]EEB36499.1 pseudouridine synthase, RluA family [Anaerococcus hydrogenalis DSM 7454]